MKAMSRDARKVIDYLGKLSGRSYAASDVFAAESLVYSFFPNVINNIIKRIYTKASNEAKFEIQYYDQPVRSMNKQRRNEGDWVLTQEEMTIYLMVSNFLLEDFNNDQQQQLREICSFSQADVSEAIKVARQEDIHSIPYIYRVLEGIKVRRDHKAATMDRIRADMLAPESPGEVIIRGPVELATLAYGWQQAVEDAELKQRLDRLYRGEGRK